MSGPLERVAHALYDFARTTTAQTQADGASNTDWRDFLPPAQAVIAALREPSSLMIDAGSELLRTDAKDLSDVAARDDAANIWRVMIDTSALAD